MSAELVSHCSCHLEAKQVTGLSSINCILFPPLLRCHWLLYGTAEPSNIYKSNNQHSVKAKKIKWAPKKNEGIETIENWINNNFFLFSKN
jgi:hypothetical protein